MKKTLMMLVLLLSLAGTSFGQSLVADAKPACSTPQIGAYGSFEAATDSSAGYALLNPVPLGFMLCGTYSKITVEMKTPVPTGYSGGVIFGIFDKTTNTYMDCAVYSGDTSCYLIGGAHYDGTTWTYPSTVTFNYGDDIFFVVYIPSGSAYTIQNITWRLE